MFDVNASRQKRGCAHDFKAPFPLQVIFIYLDDKKGFEGLWNFCRMTEQLTFTKMFAQKDV